MAIVINGSGTVTGLAVGGLPDGTVDAGTLATDSVSAVKIAANSVDSAELIDGAIDTSHLASGVVGTNTPSVRGRLSGNQSFGSSTWTKINWNTEDWDTNSAFASSKFTVPSGEGGKYLISWTVCISGASDITYGTVAVYKNGSSDLTTRSVMPGSTNLGEFFTGNTVTLSLAATDYIEFYGMSNDGGNFVYTQSSFSISKLVGA